MSGSEQKTIVVCHLEIITFCFVNKAMWLHKQACKLWRFQTDKASDIPCVMMIYWASVGLLTFSIGQESITNCFICNCAASYSLMQKIPGGQVCSS